MHLYKNFFKLLKNNRTGIIIYGVIFLVMVIGLAFSSKASGGTDTTYTRSYNVTYTDLDKTAFSRGFIEALSENNTVTDLENEGTDKVQDLVFFGMSDCHFTIENGQITYMTDFENGGGAYMLTHIADSYKTSYDAYKLMGRSDEEAASAAASLVNNETQISIAAGSDAGEGSNDIAVFYLNQYYGYLAIGFMALGVGHTVIANNDPLTTERVDASPVKRRKISLANTLGLVTSGCVLWAVFLIISLILGRGSSVIANHLVVVAVNSFLVTLIACSLASLITSFSISSNSLAMVTNIISLGMSFMCGVFVAQQWLGEGILKVARFFPLYWNVYANNMTSTLGGVDYDPEKILLCFGIQLLFAAAFSVIAAIVKSTRVSRLAK